MAVGRRKATSPIRPAPTYHYQPIWFAGALPDRPERTRYTAGDITLSALAYACSIPLHATRSLLCKLSPSIRRSGGRIGLLFVSATRGSFLISRKWANRSPYAVPYRTGQSATCASRLDYVLSITSGVGLAATMGDSPGAQVTSDRLDAGSDARTSETLPPTTASPADPPISPSSADALARFEFEKGKANEGTKILMIEWKAALSDESSSPQDHEGWEVDFEGKAASFPLSEEDDSGTRRVYFLIAPQVSIPPSVTISQQRTGRKLVTKSMPAIFAPGLGVDSKDAGKRGVLHTLWAKKRLSQLQEEIRKELRDNSEGIGLEMALQERQWIVDHFGLEQPDIEQQPTAAAAAAVAAAPPLPPTPQTPRSPIGGRLGERLRGLKLATSSSDLRGNLGKTGEIHTHLLIRSRKIYSEVNAHV